MIIFAGLIAAVDRQLPLITHATLFAGHSVRISFRKFAYSTELNSPCPSRKRPSFLVLLLLAILHVSRAAAPTSPPLFQQGHPELGDNSFRTDEEKAASLVEKLKKLLGLSKTAATNAVDDFAEATIQKMLKSDKFKRTMFKKWDEYSLEQIKTNMDRTKYAELLLEYAKKFRSYKKWK